MRPASISSPSARDASGGVAQGVVLLVALLAFPVDALGQRAEPAGVGRAVAAGVGPAPAPDSLAPAYSIGVEGRLARASRDVPPGARVPAPAPWWAPLASALAPGAGQAALQQDRWIAYAAAEGVAWLRFVADRQEAHREQRGYRRIANSVARALFTTGTPAAGSFEYYETMEKWAASGVYDLMPDAELQPEIDSTTFNGAMWLLARQTYWANIDEPPLPESDAYRNAIAFYQRRAIRPAYRWSWLDAQLQQDLYRRTILRSNAAYRRATEDLAAVLANHVLSTVDSYVTLRLRRRPGLGGGETWIEASVPWP